MLSQRARHISETVKKEKLDVSNPWILRKSTGTLYHKDHPSYLIDLERCTTSSEVLDWIAQLATKQWVSTTDLGMFVRMLDSILHFQSRLCPSGTSLKITIEELNRLITVW